MQKHGKIVPNSLNKNRKRKITFLAKNYAAFQINERIEIAHHQIV